MASPTPALSNLSSVKLALMAKQARAQLGPIVRAEPIAVVGIGCRFPGGADSPEAYWNLLRDGVDAVGDVPADRWDVDALYDPDPAAPGKMSARSGGFLREVDRFDAHYFGILRREAERMDPQQRLFLEVAIEALDHAGLPRERLAGSATGVFIASYYNDYTLMQLADHEWIDGRTLTGTQHSVLANRLSYLLDLRGPSISVDTACSSSLVAVHLACQSLRAGESDAALAGGVSLMLAPELMITLSKVGFMSASGRCRTFDAAADGFIRGEGCGVVVLKRLSDAIADSDQVLAVIRGSAVNQDGHSTVLAAPSGLAQQALLREALANAQLSPSRVGFVEAHGTATPLGDPIEVEALAAVIGAPRADDSSCYLGSAKANLGHLEAAAGVAGLIKATLVLSHAQIPRQLHFERLNPHLSLSATCLAVADRHLAWEASTLPRVAGVSGFGVGGTNAHVVLEEAPTLPASTAPGAERPELLTLSAQSSAALTALASAWLEFLPSTTAPFTELAATAGARRTHYDHRLALVALSKEQAVRQLRAFVDGEPSAEVSHGQRPTTGAPRVAFVFSGQGPQWAQMSSALSASEPVFRDTLADLDARFRAFSGWSLTDALAAPAASSRLAETELAQPAIFAVQVALAALWRAYGVEPAAVVGHSIGELAALHVAGVLSLDDAVRIVWHRGRIMQRATGNGKMAAAAISEADARALVLSIGPELSIAAVNAPRSVVLSGTAPALDAALSKLSAQGVSHRALPVSYAFHSAQMDAFQPELVAAIGALQTSPSRIAVYSSVTGAELDDGAVDAGYFGRNLRQTVRFAAAIDALQASQLDAFVELSPHPVLASSIAECLAERGQQTPVVGAMRRERPAREIWLRACAALYAVGVSPRWQALFGSARSPAELPRYPWQRERYWIRPRAASAPTTGVSSALLGSRGADGDDVWYRTPYPSGALGWLADHRVAGHEVMPAVALLETLHAAAAASFAGQSVTILDFLVHQPFLLDGANGWTSVVSLDADGARLELWASAAAGRPNPSRDRLIASARATTGPGAPAPAPSGPTTADWDTRRDELYARFGELGVDFGPSFRTLQRWRLGESSAEAWLELAPRESPGTLDSCVSATLLDGALQLCLLAASAGLPRSLLLPVAVESFARLRRLPARVRAQARIVERGASGSLTAAVRLFSEDDRPIAVLDGVQLAPADAAALTDVGPYEARWRLAAPGHAPAPANGRWLVLTDGSAPIRSLVDALQAAGEPCVQLGSDVDLASALTEANAGASAAVRGLIHAFSLDADERDGGDRYDLLTARSALTLIQTLGRGLLPGVPLWLITHGAQPVLGSVERPRQAALWGLLSVAAAEHADRPCRVIDLELAPGPESIAELALSLRDAQTPGESAIRAGTRYVPRLERRDASSTRHAGSPATKLVCVTPGTLDGLQWLPATAEALRIGEVRLRVVAAGLNFRDVLLALGMYPAADAVLGGECAGVVVAVGDGVSSLEVGDAVFGFAPGGLASEVVVPAHYLAKLPQALPPETAAALPAAFLTAMYGLERVARLEPGSSILVHAGAGGVGLSAIQVARRRGCRVFATAGSSAKRELLKTLGVEQVFDSRSLAFAEQLLDVTHGKGVDAVLNSLSGDFIAASLRALGRDGWFLELGKRDIWSAAQMREARPDVRYRVYDLGAELEADPKLGPSLLTDLCARLADGSFQPLPVRVFDFDAATDAFRLMAQAGHIGKLVLRAPGAPERRLVQTNATYWITGGGGALGVHTARWLVAAGARQLMLTGRHEPSAAALSLIEECRAHGARIEFRVADAGDAAAMGAVRDELRAAWPPLKGVVHTAGVVDDGVLQQQTWERWRQVVRGKVEGARILDALTADDSLDFFVLYSSAGWRLGPLGQGAYAAANAELDALAWARRASGRPALSVGWGQWRDGGMAARLSAKGHDTWSARGLGWLTPREAFDQLERLLLADCTHALVLPIDWQRFTASLPPGVDPAFFEAVRPAPRAARGSVATIAKTSSPVEAWRAAPAGARRELLLAHLIERTRHVLGVGDDVALDLQAPLKAAGLDSLMAVELRNLLTRSLGISLPATLLFDYPALDALATYLSTALQLMPNTLAASAETSARDALDAVAQLTDAEAEAELLAELAAGAEASR
jgi:acyl transferase domain-containing protein/NADPH:quinone reductase-like Zn-dependent oxidoreductase/acyl carrier protein